MNGTNGLDGTARAYGLVRGTTVTQSKNIVGVTNPSTGTYCITLAAGIDPSTTGLVLTPDYSYDDTSNVQFVHIEWDSYGCGTGPCRCERS
jgi:hypothetical protein